MTLHPSILAAWGVAVLALMGLAQWMTSPLAVWLHLLEPWLLAASLMLLGSLLLEARNAAACAVAILVVGGSLVIRSGPILEDPVVKRPRHLRSLKGCAVLAKEPKGPVRLAVWTVEKGTSVQRGLEAIVDSGPDIVVIRGTDRPGVAMRLQEALDGEAKVQASSGGGVITVTRGSFQYCGGEQDQWDFDLSLSTTAPSQASVAFPYVTDIGVVPLVIAGDAGPTGPSDWLHWPDRVHQGASTVAAAVRILGGSNAVVVSDFFAPPIAAVLLDPLSGAGLRWAHSPPNWPERLAGVPLPRLHAMDQVWAGPLWTVQHSRVLTSSGHPRAPVVIDLAATGVLSGPR